MAAPDYVPRPPSEQPRVYQSPPRRPDPWMADRPAELSGAGQPSGGRLGSQGPDQGYVLRLARQFDDQLQLGVGEHHEDVIAGAAAVALKRASLYGRGPVVHDLRVALTIWGYLDEDPDTDLVALRRPLFEDVANPHHYGDRRAIADMVPAEVLGATPDAISERHRDDWRSLISVPVTS